MKKELTSEVVQRVLKETGGNLGLAAAMFKKCRGFEWVELKDVKERINKSPALAYIYRADRIAIEPDATSKSDEELSAMSALLAEQLNAANALFGMSLSEDEVYEYLRCQELGKQFITTVDAAHGMAMKQMLKIQTRLSEISEKYLANENNIQALDDEGIPVIRDDGTPVMVPEVPPETKIMWQREATMLVDQLRKINADVVKSAAVRINAMPKEKSSPLKRAVQL